MDIIQQLDKEQVEKLSAGKEIPDFQPGDTVLVNVKVVEGDKARVQAYEGVCIGRSGRGINENFTVRKISYGEGVERVFPLYSPMINSIKVVRRGKVRRAKLYYLRGLRGKKARISEAQGSRRAGRRRSARLTASHPRMNKGVACRPLFYARCLRCRSRTDWLYSPHGFQSSANCPGRSRAVAVAVFRPADGSASGTLIARPCRSFASRFPFHSEQKSIES